MSRKVKLVVYFLHILFTVSANELFNFITTYKSTYDDLLNDLEEKIINKSSSSSELNETRNLIIKNLGCSCCHCYFIEESKVSFDEAITSCERQQNSLLTFFNQEELEFVQKWLKLIEIFGFVGDVFTSAQARTPDRNFNWVTDSKSVDQWTGLKPCGNNSGFEQGRAVNIVLNSTSGYTFSPVAHNHIENFICQSGLLNCLLTPSNYSLSGILHRYCNKQTLQSTSTLATLIIDSSTVELTTEISTVESTTDISTVESTTDISTVESTTEINTIESTTEISTVESTTDISTVELTTQSSTVELTTQSSTVELTTQSSTVELTTQSSTVESTTQSLITITPTTEKSVRSPTTVESTRETMPVSCNLNSIKDIWNNSCSITTKMTELIKIQKNESLDTNSVMDLNEKLTEIQMQMDENVNKTTLKKYFEIQSIMINKHYTSVWKEMSSVQIHQEVTKLTNLVEDNKNWLRRKNNGYRFRVHTENIVVRFEVNQQLYFKNKIFLWDNENDNDSWTSAVTIPQYIDSDNNNIVLVGALYKTLHNILQKENNHWKIESPIFTVKLANMHEDIDKFNENQTILITLPKLTSGLNNLVCGFLLNDSWSVEGCRLNGTNKTHINCSCTHLTSFALLMNLRDDYEDTEAEFILTLICGIISIICEVMTILIFQCFRSLWTLRATITKNLCITLSIGTLFLLVGFEQIPNQTLCFVVAVGLHYFFLSAFTWMGIEGHCLYMLLVKVFQTKNNFKASYYLIGYGIPAVFVVLSAGIQPSAYGSEKYCWLRMSDGFNWVFVGPVTFIITLNVIFLILAVRSALSVSALRDEKTSIRIRKYLKGAISLSTLLGITWVFGYINFVDKTKTLTYIFIILNGLQGLFIFIFHCVSNEHVKQVLRRKVFDSDHTFWKYQFSKSKIGSSTKTHSTNSEFPRRNNKLTPVNSSSSATSNTLSANSEIQKENKPISITSSSSVTNSPFSITVNKHMLY